MKKSKWNALLAKGKTQWKSVKSRYQERFAGSQVPSGVYVMKFQEGIFSEKNGIAFLERKFIILEGEHKGVVVSDRWNLFNEWQGAFAIKWLNVMDYEVKEITELEDIIAELNEKNPVVKGRVKQSDFTNIEVLSVLDEDEVDDAETETETESGTESEAAEDEVDLDKLDKDQLIKLVIEQEIDPIQDLKFKNKIKYKRASEEDIRKALEVYSAAMETSSTNIDTDTDTNAESEDDLLEEAKLFCATQDIDVESDYDLEDVTDLISEEIFKEKDLDDDDKELLGKLNLTKCIEVKKARKPRKSKS